MSNFLDVRKKKDWAKAIELERERIAEVAKDEELKFCVTTIWCKTDPRGEENWIIPRPVPVFGLFAGDDDEVEMAKDRYAHDTRVLIVAGDAVAMTTSNEAWLSMISKEEYEAGNFEQPRKRANRQEALLVIAEHREFGQEFWSSPISHPKKKRTLGEWELRNYEGMSGRLVFAAMPHIAPMRQKLQQAARVILQINERLGLGKWVAN